MTVAEVRADSIVENLRDSLIGGRQGLDYFPTLLRCVIDDDLWRDRVVGKTGERARFARFEDFVAAPPYAGLGTTMETIRALCRAGGDDGVKLLASVDRVSQHGNGGDRRSASFTVNNVHTETRPAGNSSQRAIRQLRQRAEAGDERVAALYAAVIAGEISPHAAVVEAGLRRRTISVPADDADRLVDALRRNLDPAILAAVVRALAGDKTPPMVAEPRDPLLDPWVLDDATVEAIGAVLDRHTEVRDSVAREALRVMMGATPEVDAVAGALAGVVEDLLRCDLAAGVNGILVERFDPDCHARAYDAVEWLRDRDRWRAYPNADRYHSVEELLAGEWGVAIDWYPTVDRETGKRSRFVKVTRREEDA